MGDGGFLNIGLRLRRGLRSDCATGQGLAEHGAGSGGTARVCFDTFCHNRTAISTLIRR
jgi:hypothetical protein